MPWQLWSHLFLVSCIDVKPLFRSLCTDVESKVACTKSFQYILVASAVCKNRIEALHIQQRLNLKPWHSETEKISCGPGIRTDQFIATSLGWWMHRDTTLKTMTNLSSTFHAKCNHQKGFKSLCFIDTSSESLKLHLHVNKVDAKSNRGRF